MKANILSTILAIVTGFSCLLAINGNASNHRNIGTYWVGSLGMTLNKSGNRAYLINFDKDLISRCRIDSATGTFFLCYTVGTINFPSPDYIALNTSGTRAFVLDYRNNKINQCDVNTTSVAKAKCVDTGGTGFSKPRAFVLSKSGKRAFIINAGNTTISRCDVDSETGAFSRCSDTGGTNFSKPISLVLNASETLAFVVNSGNNTVSRCDVDANGAFSKCSDTKGTGFSFPNGIKLNASGTLAFVVNTDSSTISRCHVDSGGIFSKCSNTGGTGFSSPTSVLLNASDTLAFVANYRYFYHKIVRCNVDKATGAFSNCFNVFYHVGVVSNKDDNVGLQSNFEHKITIDKGDDKLKSIDVINTSTVISSFNVALPPDDKNIQQLHTTCHSNMMYLKRRGSCKIFYKVPSDSSNFFSKNILFKSGSTTIAHLEVARDPVFFVAPQYNKDMYLSSITDYSLQKSSRTVTIQVKKRKHANITSASFSLSTALSDANITLSGDCMNKTSPLVSADSCHITYNIPPATIPVFGHLLLTTNLGTTRLPFSVKSQGFYLSVSKYKARSSTIPVPVNAFTFVQGRSYIIHVTNLSKTPFKIEPFYLGRVDVANSTCKIGLYNKKNCYLTIHLSVNKNITPYSELTILSGGVFYGYPILKPQTPNCPVTVANKGGYDLWFQYPVYQNIDGSMGVERSKTFLVGQSVTDNMLEGTQILLHAVGLLGRSMCLTVDHANGHLRCTRALFNMVCYWDDGKGKSSWIRTVKDHQGHVICPDWVN